MILTAADVADRVRQRMGNGDTFLSSLYQWMYNRRIRPVLPSKIINTWPILPLNVASCPLSKQMSHPQFGKHSLCSIHSLGEIINIFDEEWPLFNYFDRNLGVRFRFCTQILIFALFLIIMVTISCIHVNMDETLSSCCPHHYYNTMILINLFDRLIDWVASRV